MRLIIDLDINTTQQGIGLSINRLTIFLHSCILPFQIDIRTRKYILHRWVLRDGLISAHRYHIKHSPKGSGLMWWLVLRWAHLAFPTMLYAYIISPLKIDWFLKSDRLQSKTTLSQSPWARNPGLTKVFPQTKFFLLVTSGETELHQLKTEECLSLARKIMTCLSSPTL